MENAKTDIAYIYGLLDPFSGQLRYIGQTANTPRQRYKDHLSEARAGYGGDRHWWILSLLIRGQKPRLITLKVVPKQDRLKRELELIRAARAAGFPMVNQHSLRSRRWDDGFYAISRPVRHWAFREILQHYPVYMALRELRDR